MFFDVPKTKKVVAPIQELRPDPYTAPVEKPVAVDYFTESELEAEVGSMLVWDIELYPNYFLIAFKSVVSGKVICFEWSPDSTPDKATLRCMLEKFCIVGFNSKGFDEPILWLFLSDGTFEDLRLATAMIIENGARVRDVENHFQYRTQKTNHIDLIEVAPGQASLKIYNGRLHGRRMQDLPYDPTKPLTAEQAQEVKLYCINDLDSTELLLKELEEPIKLREKMGFEYGLDLRSKSDAQIAETVICNEVKKLSGFWPKRPEIAPGKAYRYNLPGFMEFQTPRMQEVLRQVLESDFVVSEKGSIQMPDALKELTITIGETRYNMGIGGLHSMEHCAAHIAGEDELLIDSDVASYYPRIILNLELYPEHMGNHFLEVYNTIVERRLAAKARGDKATADSLKITINGSFGKFGSKYSGLYSPQLLFQVTLTGQLSLLMLIESLELAGISVVSANTDGIVIKCKKSQYDTVGKLIHEWEYRTGFEMEETRYKALYSRDVNNYIAVKESGGYKGKGAYADVGLQKNPSCTVIVKAVTELLTKGIDVETTIHNCEDVREFIAIRNVRGGGEKDGVFLGKAVRWYYKKGEWGDITYAKSGNKVPVSEGAWPLMTLPDNLPTDINHQWYIDKAYSILNEIGYL
jgi:hypothetical protein